MSRAVVLLPLGPCDAVGWTPSTGRCPSIASFMASPSRPLSDLDGPASNRRRVTRARERGTAVLRDFFVRGRVRFSAGRHLVDRWMVFRLLLGRRTPRLLERPSPVAGWPAGSALERRRRVL